MKSLLVIATAATLLQHLMLGCCWHHQACAHAGESYHAAHGQHHCAGDQINHQHEPPLQGNSHGCAEGHCWWLADHASLQTPPLERLFDVMHTADTLATSNTSPAATAEHLPHGLAILAPPVRAHLWNQQLLL